MFDAIVAGAGPAGSAVAKKCAEYGLKTLIVDKKRLPRDKICGGLVADFAHILIKQEFGEIPRDVFCRPPQIAGHIFHVVGGNTEKFDEPEGLTWRRNLDFWMNRQAQAKGVELWQHCSVVGVKDNGKTYVITVDKQGEKQDLETRFIIGADGADSPVRKNIFPSFKPTYLQAYEEQFPASSLDLDPAYAHDFYSIEYNTLRNQYAYFNCLFKDDVIVLQFTDKVGQASSLAKRGKKVLADHFNFSSQMAPILKGACLVPLIGDELVSHTFSPARRNAMLVGDAGGLNVFAGLAPCIKSGVSAFDAIKRVLESGGEAANYYLPAIEPIIDRIKDFSDLTGKINKEMETGGKNLAKVFGEATYEATKTY